MYNVDIYKDIDFLISIDCLKIKNKTFVQDYQKAGN